MRPTQCTPGDHREGARLQAGDGRRTEVDHKPPVDVDECTDEGRLQRCQQQQEYEAQQYAGTLDHGSVLHHELGGVEVVVHDRDGRRVADVEEDPHEHDQPEHGEPDEQLPLLLGQLASSFKDLRAAKQPA